MSRDPEHSPAPGRAPAEPDDDETPVLPSVTRDEVDEGWGDESSQRDEEWYRRERPPHHDR
jgi:hypothetical protein